MSLAVEIWKQNKGRTAPFSGVYPAFIIVGVICYGANFLHGISLFPLQTEESHTHHILAWQNISE